jgi:hypothetical protein
MGISAPDRKLLWGRSGGVCAKCRGSLTDQAEEEELLVLIGIEAHIVSPKPKGPRHRDLPVREQDSYDNLILLCPNDHALVDKRPDLFPEEALRELKKSHEAWVKQHPSPSSRIRLRDPRTPLVVRKVTEGTELMNEVGPALSLLADHPEPRSIEEAELLSGFLGGLHDLLDLWGELGLGERVSLGFELGREIGELNSAGLSIFAGHRQKILEGGEGPPLPWREGIVLDRPISEDGDPPFLEVVVTAN